MFYRGTLRESLTQYGLHQGVGVGLILDDLGFQLVADGEKLFDFGDDGVLFGKWCERERQVLSCS